jgi:L-lactate utilization protein LutB
MQRRNPLRTGALLGTFAQSAGDKRRGYPVKRPAPAGTASSGSVDGRMRRQATLPNSSASPGRCAMLCPQTASAVTTTRQNRCRRRSGPLSNL